MGIAFAQQAGAAASGGMSTIMNFVPIILMIVVFYFLLIMPQQKREKERKKMIAALQKGDRVLTASGMYGIIDSLKDDNTVVLKISTNTKVEFLKSAITGKA